MIQINQQIITLFYALYNKGVNVTVSLAKLCLGDIYSQKASALLSMLKKENSERKIAKYLVVPNICILSLSLSLSLSLPLVKPGLTKILIFCVRAREACRANYSKQRTFRSFLCYFFVSLSNFYKGKITQNLQTKVS